MNPACLTVLTATLSAVVAQESRGTRPRALLHVTGRVLDDRGLPLAGAGFTVGATNGLMTNDALERPSSRCAADGTFAVEMLVNPESGGMPGFLVTAPGKVALRMGEPREAGCQRNEGDTAWQLAASGRGLPARARARGRWQPDPRG